MGIDTIGAGQRPLADAANTSRTQSTTLTGSRSGNAAAVTPGSTGGDKLQLSDQAAQLQTLEKQIANLPVVDTQRVTDTQRTIATGRFQIEPAEVADKLLRFEAGLDRAG